MNTVNHIAADLFKAYDIRGIVGQNLTENAARLIGLALAERARAIGCQRIALGRDGRLSGERLMAALEQGLHQGGIDTFNIGMAATPMLYFAATQHCGGSGIMITGSHNPPEYNGFKMMLGGTTLAGETIRSLEQRINSGAFTASSGGLPQGTRSDHNIAQAYRDHIVNHIQLQRPMHIVIDAGNGIAGAFAGDLYRALGCQVHELYCEVDGHFPNHHPDPAKPENLQELIATVRETGAELGLAFDGDGDRLGVVTRDGQIIYPDRQLMLFAQDVLSRNPDAAIIFDVKSTRLLTPWIQQHGGRAIMEKTGHSFIKAAIKQHNALLAGEMSGHVFFKERWFGFDDGLYAGARLLEILSASTDPSATLNALPQSLSTPEINLPLPQGSNGHAVVAQIAANAHFNEPHQRITIDGLRVEFADGFGLLRASNTTPVLVMRFEADNETALNRIRDQFRQIIEKETGLTFD